MAQPHTPIELKFNSMNFYGCSAETKVSFTSNRNHEISIALLPEEREAILSIVNGSRARALKEIPEMIAEVIAEERVTQILAKREQEALELKAKEQPIEEGIVF